MAINSEIAFTYINTNKRLTAVASLGILLGMAVYIFMNSMLAGFGRSSDEQMFKVTPHIRIYSEPTLNRPLAADGNTLPMILNPTMTNATGKINNPMALVAFLKKQENIKIASPQVAVNAFLPMGTGQLAIRALGVVPSEADVMFSIAKTMIFGSVNNLSQNPSGILVGAGIAEKLNLKMGDNINLSSSKSVSKIFKVCGVFLLNNKKEDDIKAYINQAAAQQLLKENAAYVTDINLMINDHNKAPQIAEYISGTVEYKVEDWQKANETLVAGFRMRRIIISLVSTMILIIAGFGIYNILNMTVSQKINDIAILKAMGFEGRDVVRIFVTQAIVIGLIGVFFGVLLAILMVTILKKVYVGGDIGYFPIDYEPLKFLQGIVFGFFITFLAGYIPARKAARVDPVQIFRK